MSYRVQITSAAIKDRKRLDVQVRERIDRALRKLRQGPRPHGVRKLRGSKHDWRLRVGDYRILYEIDDERRLVTVWRIAHRRDAYR